MQAEKIVNLIDSSQYELTSVLSYILVYLAIIWLLFCGWVLKDISSRTRNPVYIIISTVFVLTFNLPGLLLYLMLRPEKTIEEAKALDVHLLSQLEDGLINCPDCANIMRRHYKFCTVCGANLEAHCHSCAKQVNPVWLSCAYCGANLQVETKEKVNHRLALILMRLAIWQITFRQLLHTLLSYIAKLKISLWLKRKNHASM